MRKMENSVDKGIFMCFNNTCEYELNGKINNDLNNKSLPCKLVRLIINNYKVDT